MARTINARSNPRLRGKSLPLGQTAYKIIRERILEQVFQPGEALVEARLAEDLGMSRTPIRDALSRLEQEGLVVAIPNKGTFVESLRPFDVAEIFDIREVIEGLAARLLTRRITRSQTEIIQELARKADGPDATVSDDAEFHFAIVRMSGSPRLMEMVKLFCLQAMTYDDRTNELASEGNVPVIKDGRTPHNHTSLLEKILSGDAAATENAVREHIRFGKNVVARHLLGLDDF